MNRKTRLEKPDSFYYVICTGQRDNPLFFLPADNEKYLNTLECALNKYDFILHAYCLLKNQVHLLLRENGAPLSELLHYVNTKYAMYFNSKRSLTGHVFQDRCQSYLIGESIYMRNVISCIHMLPVKKGFCISSELYTYSSAAFYAGKSHFKIMGMRMEKCFPSRAHYLEQHELISVDFPVNEGFIGSETAFLAMEKRNLGLSKRSARERRGAADRIANSFQRVLTEEKITLEKLQSMKYTRQDRKILRKIFHKLIDEKFTRIAIASYLNWNRVTVGRILKENSKCNKINLRP
ncbi:transposase [bacterium]|nr:transposase [bacterium]